MGFRGAGVADWGEPMESVGGRFSGTGGALETVGKMGSILACGGSAGQTGPGNASGRRCSRTNRAPTLKKGGPPKDLLDRLAISLNRNLDHV